MFRLNCEILLKLCEMFCLGFAWKQATPRTVMKRKEPGSNTSQVVSVRSEKGGEIKERVERERVRSRSKQADIWEDGNSGKNLAAGVGGEGKCVSRSELSC